jgi:hypothetical protein
MMRAVWRRRAVCAIARDMKKLMLGVAALGAVGYGVYHHGARPATPSTQTELVENRLWIDHMPRSERDTIQVFLTLGDEGIGTFQQTSAWKGSYELFEYEGHAGELRIIYPQTGERDTVKAKATKCRENGFDYCLEMAGGSRGVKRYYSMKDWEIGSMRDLDSKVKALGTPSPDPSSAHK